MLIETTEIDEDRGYRRAYSGAESDVLGWASDP